MYLEKIVRQAKNPVHHIQQMADTHEELIALNTIKIQRLQEENKKLAQQLEAEQTALNRLSAH